MVVDRAFGDPNATRAHQPTAGAPDRELEGPQSQLETQRAAFQNHLLGSDRHL